MSSAEHPFARFVRILGKGKSGTRALSQAEARDAFTMIMQRKVEPLQLGAFLMLLRVKEETAEELAGFAQACRSHSVTHPQGLYADLDWPSYAGKKHQHPWFILSLLLLAQAGYRVFIHGSQGHTQGRLYTEAALRTLNLPVATNWQDVALQLDEHRMSYLPLREFCPPLDELMQLRPILGLRSPVNTLARLLNPLAAACVTQSIFHPAYGSLHQEADKLLGQPRALVYKGDSGEIEIKPQADTRLMLLDNGNTTEVVLPRSIETRVDSVDFPCVEPLRQLWRGESDMPYGLQATLATTAASLALLIPNSKLTTTMGQAHALWDERDRTKLDPCH